MPSRLLALVPALLALLALPTGVRAQALESTLLPPGAEPATEVFGQAIAVSGDRMLVGARRTTTGPHEARAFVYQRSGDTWLLESVIAPPLNNSYDTELFGAAVAISGSWAVVGAPTSDQGGTAFVYHHDGTSWGIDSTIRREVDNFGAAVAVQEGGLLLVGSPWDQVTGTNSGFVYAWRASGDDWIGAGSLYPSNPVAQALFGSAISISETHIAVGAPGHADPLTGARTGAVAMYTWDANAFGLHQFLYAGDRVDGDAFGGAVALSSNELVVGAHGRDGYTGAAYHYRNDTGLWIEQQVFTPPQLGSGALFGLDVAISAGSSIAVGAKNDSALYAFGWNGSTYALPSDPFVDQSGGTLGTAVAAFGDRIVASRPHGAIGSGDPGSVRTYHWSQCSNGRDDDGDGALDLADPDCASDLDHAEWQLADGDVVVANWSARVERLDPVTGARTVLSSGAPFGNPMGAAIAPNGDVLISDNKRDAVFRLDRHDGRVTEVTSGGYLSSPRYMALDADGNGLVCNQSGSVVRVTLSTGSQVALNASADIGWCEGIAADTTGQIAVTDRSGDRLVQVDAATGQTTATTPGGYFYNAIGIAFEDRDHVVIVDDMVDEIWRVDLPSNTRTTLSLGQYLSRPRGIAVEADGQLLVADLDGGLIRIDPDESATINQTQVSPDFGTPMGATVYLPEPGAAPLVAAGAALVLLLGGHRARRRITD